VPDRRVPQYEMNSMTNYTLPHEATCDVRDRLGWLGLTLTPGLGPRRILEAVKLLETPSQIFELSLTELEALQLSVEAAQFLFDGKGRKAAEAELGRT
jgi:DNA processing protein